MLSAIARKIELPIITRPSFTPTAFPAVSARLASASGPLSIIAHLRQLQFRCASTADESRTLYELHQTRHIADAGICYFAGDFLAAFSMMASAEAQRWRFWPCFHEDSAAAYRWSPPNSRHNAADGLTLRHIIRAFRARRQPLEAPPAFSSLARALLNYYAFRCGELQVRRA